MDFRLVPTSVTLNDFGILMLFVTELMHCAMLLTLQ